MVIREVVVSMASFACGVLGNLILPVGPYGTPILVGPSWRDSYLLWIVKVLEPIMVLLVFGVGVRSTSLPAYFLGLIFWTGEKCLLGLLETQEVGQWTQHTVRFSMGKIVGRKAPLTGLLEI